MYLTGLAMRNILVKRVPGFSSDGYLEAINEAYSSLAEFRSWSFLENNFNLTTQALVSSGGAHFTNGAATITASTCADWSSGISSGFAGMYIKPSEGASFYLICASTTTIVTINVVYPGATTTAVATAGEGYKIFKHIYAVNSGIETVIHLMHDTYLRDWDEKEIETKDPDIQEQGSPFRWRAAGNDSTGCTLVELYPRLVDDVYSLRGKGQIRIETITDSTKPLLNSYLILSLAELDLLRRKRLISPDSVPDDILNSAVQNIQDKLDIAVKNDMRKTTGARYTPDRLFGEGYRGHQWYVENDPLTF